MTPRLSRNIDARTVRAFGDEWAAFDQSALDPAEHRRMFDRYFRIFPLEELGEAEGFDLGCGSGRWALLVAPQVRTLHCIDAAEKAVEVSRRQLRDLPNVELHLADAHAIPLPDESQDFGYSLGVLHHVPNPEAALARCVAKLRPGAPFLLYLYYRLDRRPGWYRALWRISDFARRGVSRLPFGPRRAAAELFAAVFYYPLSRAALVAEQLGVDVTNWPLGSYRDCSFFTMRTDALDRFGTRLEHRFSRPQIEAMMKRCGLVDIRFSEETPFWVAVGRKRSGVSA